MCVLLVGIYSEGSVWLVREVRQVLRLLGVGSKTKNWVDCNIPFMVVGFDGDPIKGHVTIHIFCGALCG